MIRGLVILFLTGIVLVNVGCQSENYYFELARKNIEKYKPSNKNLFVVIDYRKNIFSERLYILDLNKNEIVFSCKVSHAWNSGFLRPTDYSNQHGTNKSSKGNFITKGTRYGYFGYSMIVKGLDRDINDNAQSRAIIFHSDKKMKTLWSKGCFTTSEEDNKKIIDMIKGGTLISVID
jgi:hypothetical protein